jgi:hypothetical protein
VTTEAAVLALLKSHDQARAQQHAELKAIIESTHVDVQALSLRFDLHEQNNEHVHEQHGKRLSYLEELGKQTGEHQLVELQSKLAERGQVIDQWRGRVWSMVAALLLSSIVGLVTHYLSTK